MSIKIIKWFDFSDNRRDPGPEPQPGPSARTTAPTTLPTESPNPSQGTSSSSNTVPGGGGQSFTSNLTAHHRHHHHHQSTNSSSTKRDFKFSSKPKTKKLKLIEEHDRELAEALQAEEEGRVPVPVDDSVNKKEAHKKVKPVAVAKRTPAARSVSSMESSEEYEDSGNESSGEDVEFAMERDERGPNEPNPEDEYPFTVLSTKDIVEHMVDSIREV